MDLSLLTGLQSSLNFAKELAANILAVRDFTQIEGAKAELLAKLTDAHSFSISLFPQIDHLQETITTLKKRVAELEQREHELTKWNAESEKNYELCAIAEGAVAYRRKPPANPDEAAHYLCANCFQKKQKRFLSMNEKHRFEFWRCHECGYEVRGKFVSRNTSGASVDVKRLP